MLVLTRKIDQKIQIGDDITITVIQVKGRYVRLGIDAPTNIRILRSELTRSDAPENAQGPQITHAPGEGPGVSSPPHVTS
jgi:carbon storage regulator CsrA